MGNVQKNVNTWWYRRKNGTTRLGEDTQCPKCGRFFAASTTYNTLNNHLDACLRSNFIPPEVHGDTIMRRDSMPGGSPGFYWRKTSDDHLDSAWKKVPASPAGKLVNLSMGLADAQKLDYPDKLRWFRAQIEALRIPWTEGADVIQISKEGFFTESIYKLRFCDMHKELKVEFEGEKVQDAGGLLREWVHLNIKELFLSKSGPFILAETDDATYRVNPYFEDKEAHLDLFRHAGKVIGKAIFERIPIAAYLDKTILKHLLGDRHTLEDIASLDKQIFNSLKYILDNPINKVEIIEEYFSVVALDGRHDEIVDLKPKGRHIRVNDENKFEFVQLKVDWIASQSISKKLDVFMNEIDQVIPLKYFSVFDPHQLEMVINGVSFIDVDDWQENTLYKGSYNKNSTVVKWFWELMHDLDQKGLAKILQFCTGSTRTPVEGFRILESNRGNVSQFTIESVKYCKEHALMKAHTCFNRLDLPMYPSKELLKQAMDTILSLNFEGVFGIKD